MQAWLTRGGEGCAAAGHDFLTVLGAHEGEGLVVAADALVAGSTSPHMADKVWSPLQRNSYVGLTDCVLYASAGCRLL